MDRQEVTLRDGYFRNDIGLGVGEVKFQVIVGLQGILQSLSSNVVLTAGSV